MKPALIKFVLLLQTCWYARLITAVGLAFLIYILGTSVASTDDPAAWVQATGSIAAILSSVAIVQWQHRHEKKSIERSQRTERIDFLCAVYSIASLTELYVQLAFDEGWKNSGTAQRDLYQTYCITRLQSSQVMLLEIPTFKISSATLPMNLAMLRNHVGAILRAQERRSTTTGIMYLNPISEKTAQQLLHETKLFVRSIREELDREKIILDQ